MRGEKPSLQPRPGSTRCVPVHSLSADKLIQGFEHTSCAASLARENCEHAGLRPVCRGSRHGLRLFGTMASLYDTRRYLTDFDSRRMGHVVTDVLVVGSGVAGARAAIEAARHGLVTLLCKGSFDDSATAHAQGGIATALGDNDSTQSHFEDTMRVGCGPLIGPERLPSSSPSRPPSRQEAIAYLWQSPTA